MASVFKHQPRTKHIDTKYHHFCSYVQNKLISIHKVTTADMIADSQTKPTSQDLFEVHHRVSVDNFHTCLLNKGV